MNRFDYLGLHMSVMREDPLVSIIIPTHNRLQALKRAIASARAQDYSNIELVVIDDGSRDGTWDYLSEQGPLDSWTIARNEQPLGACAARNKAIQLARGEFIANLDDDDFFESNRISRLLSAFRVGVAAVTSFDRFFSNHGPSRVWKKKRRITLDDLLYRNRAGNAFLTKKEFLLAIGGFDATLKAAQDHDLFVRLAQTFGAVVTIPEVLHNIDDEESHVRITTSSVKWIGYYDFYCKHKAHMNTAQRKSNIYIILKAKGQGALKNILRYAPLRFWPSELRGWIRRPLNPPAA